MRVVLAGSDNRVNRTNVIAGLDPAIHANFPQSAHRRLDARVKPGHDE
jgi:hypothetical protein